MKTAVSRSLNLLKKEETSFQWAVPLMEMLEQREKHTGIQWVIECLVWASEHWGEPNKSKAKEHLKNLKHLAGNRGLGKSSKGDQLKELEKKINYLWFHCGDRDDLITAVANCYAAEASFISGKYPKYRTGLIALMGFSFRDDFFRDFFKSFVSESIKKYEAIMST